MKDRNACVHVKTTIFPNAIINVHFPDLTEEKRNQRKKAMQKAAEKLLKSRRREGA